MDKKIEEAQAKANTAKWALVGMTMSDFEPERADLESLLVMVTEVNHDLNQAINGVFTPLKEVEAH